ncbi:mitochondrial protein Pet127-domain-containing protein [Halteromyces radiatus]|uniref:mitochondrial protein Pet127-domain-containing protein n=1 Tax=Halteromyces radiatus TaxID=101107 RepID=UPI0022204CDD|nr:mitochondrial protein Pet127-domain-containing protein [Halteromyces radiatus]KAI8096423.1 mitochondrial protein Pet127-domain-containing protein [Halteromyces radiatus]
MWAFRSSQRTLATSCLFSCRIQTSIYQRTFTTDIKNVGNNDKNLIDYIIRTKAKTPTSTTNSTNVKNPKNRYRRRRLLNKLKKRVYAHSMSKDVTSPVKLSVRKKKTFQNLEPILLDETKQDLDESWHELDISSQYKRIYPDEHIPVATLAHGLDKTLFKSGVHPLKDLSSKKFLFSPYLENITQPDQFDYDAMLPYRTASEDKTLIAMAKKEHARYTGSTSSLSGVLCQLYFRLSNHRPLDTAHFSRGFVNEPNQHTRGSRVPKTIYLRWKDGVYAVDADKSFDGEETVLSYLGRSMEKMLTMEPKKYERYLKENSSMVTEDERNAPEAFAYGKFGHLFLRSQLDCSHGKLPRRNFDLKTRATLPVRLDIPHYKEYYNYKLEQHHGLHYSFEREYYDMMRAAFLKYSFQVRIGHMDGIMVTYHNTNTIFGFQYISRNEMDARLFGTQKMGDQVFTSCLSMMEILFDKFTKQYPKTTLRITLDCSEPKYEDMRIFVEPVNDDENTTTKTGEQAVYDESVSDHLSMYRLYTQSYLNNKLIQGPVSVNKESDVWDIYYKLEEQQNIPKEDLMTKLKKLRRYQATAFLPQSEESPKFLNRFKSPRVISEKKSLPTDEDLEKLNLTKQSSP